MTLQTFTKVTYSVEARAVFYNEQWHPAVTIKRSSGEGITRMLDMGFEHPRFAVPYARALADEYRSAFVDIEEVE